MGGAGALTFGTAGNNTALLIQGSGAQVYAASKMLRLVDVPQLPSDRKISVVRLEHANAKEVAADVRKVFTEPMQPQQMRGYAGPSSTLIAVPHASLNAIILQVPEAQYNTVLALIADLDVKPTQAPAAPALAERVAELEAQIEKLMQLLKSRK